MSPYCAPSTRRDVAVGIIFQGASDFANLETGRFNRGEFFVGRMYRPPFSSYRPQLERMIAALDKLTNA